MASQPQAVNYLPRTYVMDKNFADMETFITMVSGKPSKISPWYAEKLEAEVLRYGDVHEKHNLNETSSRDSTSRLREHERRLGVMQNSMNF